VIVGLDIGSRSMELVVLENGKITHSATLPTTFDPLGQCAKLLEGITPSAVVGTGYGRELVKKVVERLYPECPVSTVTEIKAHALGAAHWFPEAGTVLDIGGQDTKAMAVKDGRVLKFEMNDRCAAGTGKFLEYTAGVFQIPVDEFGAYALQGDNAPHISAMCTVFAETEATSLMAQGHKPENIALGLHKSIVKRTRNMLGRVGLRPPVVFTGGVAKNPCVLSLLAEELGTEATLLVPDEPDMTGALGAALSIN
jgi:predicted CoA-substrate-specific enzyme activase